MASDRSRRPKKSRHHGAHPEIVDGALSATVAGSAIGTVSRYGSGVKEHLVALSGADAETGTPLTRSLRGISRSRVNPNDVERNLKQQAGFSAEVKEVARRRAEEAIAGRNPSTTRTDDIPGHVNDQFFDITSKVDANGNLIPGSSAQVKFVGSSPHGAVDKMLGGTYQKYIDHDCKMIVPSDFYDGMKADLEERMKSLRQQVARLESDGRTEAAAAKRVQLEKCKKLRRNLVRSKVSNAEAMEARTHPVMSTAEDIARVSLRAGLEQAKMGAAIGGGVSIVRNVVSLCKGEKEVADAVKDVVCDTAGVATLSFATGAAGAAIKGSMQNAGSRMVRALSKTNLPAYIVTATWEAGKTLKDYFTGKIDGVQCLEQLGEKGAGMVNGAMFAAIGQVAIPIPVVGALAGSMVGYALSAASYHVLTDSLKAAKLARARRIQIERECAEAIKMLKQYRAELEEGIARDLKARRLFFDQTFDAIKSAIGANDIDGYILSTNDITEAFGGKPLFKDMAGCDALMASGGPICL